ncbi:hypothetical protein KDA_63670 [Dictyobacter alpinus]|uniref:N-acetyltransferase domain-containing protein n=1 Tax=Dictyobacter alpinus TaxID=2014873 RepID=A0A402BHM8_9CHLR|nr:GNAT family protein [Dictyobacter alpinus]GCE30883.1 hypothetical protein KDA_63670 [Dictyobacter alpinus]
MSMQNSPQFNLPVQHIVLRFPDNQPYQLRSLDASFPNTAAARQDLIAASNEPFLYDRIFRERLKGKPYDEERAAYFLGWGPEGWKNNAWFVFVVLNPEGRIVATIDIKSNQLNGAEIGYWCSEQASGIMTNTVLALCDIAREAGFRHLYARIAPDNARSIGVITRSKFTPAGTEIRNGRNLLRFNKIL